MGKSVMRVVGWMGSWLSASSDAGSWSYYLRWYSTMDDDDEMTVEERGGTHLHRHNRLPPVTCRHHQCVAFSVRIVDPSSECLETQAKCWPRHITLMPGQSMRSDWIFFFPIVVLPFLL